MRNFVFALITMALSFGVGELVLRALTKPSYGSPVSLFGINLPPYRIVLDTDFEHDINHHPVQGGKGTANVISRGDMQGMIREDDVLGYTTEENQVSNAGWSHSNNIGANASTPTLSKRPDGKKRVLIFGESFSRGCGLPQSAAWSTLWQSTRPDLDIVNMGVSGYSMGQAFRRYELTQNQLDYDRVVFMFVPDSDTWRDINVMRQLGEGWGSFTLMPGYRVVNDQLTWVPGLYHPSTDVFKENGPEQTAPHVREHLRRFDAFYIPLLYESPPLLGNLITYKIFARLLGEREKRLLYDRQSNWNSEGMLVEKHLFRAASELARAKGAQFTLVLLPSPNLLENLRQNPNAAKIKAWDEVVEGFSGMGLQTYDLLHGLLAEKEEPDRGEDKAHYGPKTNAVLARLIGQQLAN